MTENDPEWNPDLVPDNPLFDDLRALFPDLPRRWPEPAELDALLPAGMKSAAGAPLRFRAQRAPLGALEYERQIHDQGRIATRERCWHDLFNALMWAAFPGAKKHLNAIQVAEGEAATDNRRSSRRDWCTLLDECGVLIASTDPQFEALHRAHRWEHLFYARRRSWGTEIAALILGHGLYQQCLSPYLGLTGKALYLAVEPDFFALGLQDRYARADRILARRLVGAGDSDPPRALLPMPVLGVPGWHPENQDRRFYRIASYFRPARH